MIACTIAMAGCGLSVHDAARTGDLDRLQRLLKADPDAVHATDRHGKTPLHMAAGSAPVETLTVLIDHGADVLAQDDSGLTPLHVSAWWATTVHAKTLIEAGADLNALDAFGNTPLHIAAMAGHNRLRMIRFLLAEGANPQERNASGRTPLEAAAAERCDRHAEYLRRMTADDQ